MSGRDEAPAGDELPELPAPEAPAPPGSATLAGMLGDRYRIVSRLGTGAFGEVYQAHDDVLGREVAIKRVRLEAFVDPAQLDDVKRRFLREAQVAARLRHPNIVTTHDIVATPRTSFIVMELVAGRTLQALLDERGRLPIAETAAILEQVAAALDHAHANQVVHRDVKPANVMVEPSGHVKVMDFGIAKAETGANLTATGLVMGTPNYMSPEQARGEQVDARSDLFSLGCVLYECLTGVRPFQAGSVASILVRILTEEPPPVDFAATSLPRAVEPLLRRATAKDPAARFASAGEMTEALRAVALGRASPPPARPRGTSALGAKTPDALTVVAKAPRASAPSQHPWRGLVAAAAVGVVSLAALVWIATDPFSRSHPSTAGVVQEPRSVVDRLLRRAPRFRITIPEGTSLRLHLGDALSSETASAGAAITASTASPLKVGGIEAVPRGARLLGHVERAVSAERGGGRGELTLVFDSLDLDQKRIDFRTRPLAMRAPAPPRKRDPAKKKGNSILADVGDAVSDLFARIKSGSGGSVEGGSAETVTVASERGREVTLSDRAPLLLELAHSVTVIRQRPLPARD